MKDIKREIAKWCSSYIEEFDDRLKVEGIPLRRFYQNLLYSSSFPFLSVNEIQELEEKKKKISLKRRVVMKIFSFLMRKYIEINENKKIRIRKGKRKKERGKGKSVLILSYTNHMSNGKIFRVGNIVKKLEKDGKLKPVVMFISPFQRKDYKRLEKCETTIYDYIDKGMIKEAKKLSEELESIWKNISEKKKRELIKTKNINLWYYQKDILNLLFSKTFIYYTILYYKAIERAIEEENVKAIVTTSAFGFFERLAYGVAKRKRIISFFIQHGINLFKFREFYPSEDSSYIIKYCVFGEIYKDFLIKAKINRKDIYVVGGVIFDDIYKYIRKKEREEYITVFTSPMVEDGISDKSTYFSFIRSLIKNLGKFNEKVVFKLHPREKYIRIYRNYVKEFKLKNIEINKKIDRDYMYDLIAKSKVVITFGSSTTLEAMILDKDIIVFYIPNLKIHKKLFKRWYKGVLHIDYKDDFKYIKEIFELVRKKRKMLIKEREEYLKKFCYKVDGKAYERIVNNIYKLLK